MTHNNNIDKYISDLENIWFKAGMYGTQYVGSTLYIMCLKKMIEENACTNPDYMSSIVELTRVLYRPMSEDDIEVIKKASDLLEETYNVKKGLLADVLSPFRSEEKAWKRAFLDIIAVTSSIVIDKDGYYPYAKELIYSTSKGGKMMSEKASSNAVSDLLSIAANVKDGETVLDGTIGYGYSVVNCIKDKNNIKLYGIDINSDSIQVATLYMILCDISFETRQEDFTAMDTNYIVDKVVMDIPFGMRPMSDLSGYQLHRVNKWMDSDSCKEMECLFMASALDAMKENGRVVLIVPQGILFKQTKALSTFRRNLVKEGLLKAIVSLPPVYNSTLVNTAMLIFEHNNKDILFVDGTSLIQRERRNEAYITEENRKILYEILEEKRIVEGISFKVSNEEVLINGDWSISKYIDVDNTIEFRSISEINKDLGEVYKKLSELNDESRSIKLFS